MLNKKKNKILIVEDSLLNQKILEGILSEDYILEKSATAKEIFAKIYEFSPDLILLDIILPDANGFDVLRSLRKGKTTSRIPVIIISGLDSEEDEEKGFLLGAVDYIKKPFKNTIVKARIGTQIQILNQMYAIEQMSYIDGLTSIFNRRAFDNKLDYEWKRAIREESLLSLLMIDVDKFKNYNDTYGHLQGDIMLQAVSIVIKSSLKRSLDVLCRYGGEEFAVILPGIGLEGAVIVAERIRKRVETMNIPHLDSGTETSTAISIGVSAQKPSRNKSMNEFVKIADNMLYKAKNNGRNQVQYEGKL